MPKPDTQPYHLLELTAITGEFPADQLDRLPGGSTYKEAIVKGLKRDRLLRTYYRDKLRGYRLGTRAKALLLADRPERFAFYLMGNADTNMLKSEITRRLRLHRIAETYITMENAGVEIFRDRKPDVFAPEGSAVERIEAPAFYNSREVKELGMDFVKIRSARSVGVLLAKPSVFVVYNSGDALMKWSYKSEMRTKALMRTILCQQRLAAGYRPDDVSGLILGAGMELAYQLLTSTGGAKHNYFVLDGNYDHFYFLTHDHYGEVILKLLCDPVKRAALDCVLSQGLDAREPGWLIENDAIDSTGNPVLFAYSCDMPRIARFNNALQLQSRTGTLICFDFQSPALRRFCGGQVKLQTIDFEKFERRFYP